MPPEALAELVQRIRKMIDEIERIQRELGHPSTDPQTGLAAPQVPIEVVSQLKYRVDRFRLFLWAYVDARNSAQSLDAEQSNGR